MCRRLTSRGCWRPQLYRRSLRWFRLIGMLRAARTISSTDDDCAMARWSRDAGPRPASRQIRLPHGGENHLESRPSHVPDSVWSAPSTPSPSPAYVRDDGTEQPVVFALVQPSSPGMRASLGIFLWPGRIRLMEMSKTEIAGRITFRVSLPTLTHFTSHI